MKKFITLIFIVFATISANAQLKYGLNLGGGINYFSAFDANGKKIDYSFTYSPAFSYNFGISIKKELPKKIDFKSEINLVSKNFKIGKGDTAVTDFKYFIENPIYTSFKINKYLNLNLGISNNINILRIYKPKMYGAYRIYSISVITGLSVPASEKFELQAMLNMEVLPTNYYVNIQRMYFKTVMFKIVYNF